MDEYPPTAFSSQYGVMFAPNGTLLSPSIIFGEVYEESSRKIMENAISELFTALNSYGFRGKCVHCSKEDGNHLGNT